MQPGAIKRCLNQREHHNHTTHVKRKPAETQCFRRFLAGAEGLEPSARGFGVDVETAHRERGRDKVAPFYQPSHKTGGAGLVLRGNFPGQNGQKRAGNPRKNGKCIDENRYGPYNKKCWSNNPRVKALCYADMVGHCFYGGIV